jgi:hypothetical protein
MAYIPDNAKWYLATLVEEIVVEGDSRNVVHKNLVLVLADCPERAYDSAMELGKKSEVSYENPDGRPVRIKFRGLSELNVVYDELEHGAELHFEELLGVSEEQIEALLRRREDLAVFRPITPSTGPDYSSRQVLQDAEQLLENARGRGPRDDT